jgi:hypothetical protein
MDVVLDPKQSTVFRAIEIIGMTGPIRFFARESPVTPVVGEAHLLGNHPCPDDAVWLHGVDLFTCKGDDEVPDTRLSANARLANGQRHEWGIVVWGGTCIRCDDISVNPHFIFLP